MAARTTKPRHSARTRRARARVPAALTALLVLGGYLTADLYDLAPGPLTLTEEWPEALPFPTPALPDHTPPVSADDGEAPLPSPLAVAQLVERFTADPATGPAPGVLVVDARTGTELAAHNADATSVPASTTKLLTAVALLDAVGDDHTIPTRVVAGAEDDPEALTLIGAGDVTLNRGESDPEATIGRGGIATLAEQVAAALAAEGRTIVSDVVVDESLWEGERLGPRWTQQDLNAGWVIPASPIALDLGRRPGTITRTSQPALDAGAALREELRGRGIDVTGQVRTGRAAGGAPELARVHSAPVRELVEYMLIYSDNVLADALGRVVAVHSGEEGSFAGAESAIIARLADLGIPTAGLRLGDTSGMSSVNQISPRTLVATLRAASIDHPHLLSAIRGLPVAGLEGTLATRMRGTEAAGTVALKTGTLLTTATVTGQVVTAEGRLLHVAVMTHDWQESLAGARAAIDRFLVGLAECGCE